MLLNNIVLNLERLKMNNKCLYTVRRCKLDTEKLYGPSHGSTTGEQTLCGQTLNHYWYITDNVFEGEITCKKCLKIMKVTPYHKLP